MVTPETIFGHFSISGIQSCRLIGNGLINSSYKVQASDGSLYFLQKINTAIFKKPLALQNNYRQLEIYLSEQQAMSLPRLIKTVHNDLVYECKGEVWRCFAFVPNTFSPLTVNTPEQAYEVSNCFGRFTARLHHFDSNKLETVIPRFHDLSFRYQEFQAALQNTSASRISTVQSMIEEIEESKYLVRWFQHIAANKLAFPLHVMHHDCKVSNILFDKETSAVRCPIDLDTTQPGLFFSDIGDMIRTMAPNKSEDEIDTAAIEVRSDFLTAITEGYTNAMEGCFTTGENESLYKSGLIMTYMQAMRFLTDYLNENVYYRTYYPEQNRNRAANQLRLLQLLKEHA